MKVLDTREYVSIMKEKVMNGEEACILIAGNSMSPFLVHERDYICFSHPKREVKKGDMVFYERENGQYVMHRIYKVTSEGYYMAGDSQMEIEGPIRREQIFALVTKVRRKGKWLESGDFLWEFFEKVWINIVPARRIVRKAYAYIFAK